MAIIRPARKGGPKRKTAEVTKVAAVIDTKKAQIEKKQAVTKKQTVEKKKPVQEKKKSPPKKKAPAKPKLLSPPKDLKTEAQWIQYLSGESIGKVSEWLEKQTPDSIDITMALSLRTIANRILKATDKKPDGFNEWLDYFSSMTRAETEAFIETHRESLDNEAMAAGMRWLQIAENPALIDKIVNSRLESRKMEEIGDIMAAAKSGDDLKLYEAIRNNLAYKIQDGAGSRDMSALIKQLNEVTTHLNAIYRERGMKDTQQDNIRKLLVNARQRSRRPKQQAVLKLSDLEDGAELESV